MHRCPIPLPNTPTPHQHHAYLTVTLWRSSHLCADHGAATRDCAQRPPQAQRAAIQGVYVGFPITQKYTTKIMCMSQIESTHNGQSVIVVVIPLRQC